MTKKREELYLKTHASKVFENNNVGEVDMVFDLINPKYGDHKYIKGRYRITWGGKVHHLRYSPAFDSPFKDEQATEGGGVEIKGVTFRMRRLYVPKSDPCLQKFMLLHPLNGKLFEKRDEEAKREARLAIKRVKREATRMLDQNLNLDKLMPVIAVLSPANPAMMKYSLSDAEEYISDKIEVNPQEVIDAFKNDEAMVMYHFNRAVAEGIVSIDTKNNKVVWVDGGGKLFDIPQGVPAWRRWITFISTVDGQIVYDHIKEQLDD